MPFNVVSVVFSVIHVFHVVVHVEHFLLVTFLVTFVEVEDGGEFVQKCAEPHGVKRGPGFVHKVAYAVLLGLHDALVFAL